MERRPEILAPAGSIEAFHAAVENGADAVYVGGQSFSARAYAGNLSLSELDEVIRYAHLRGVRVYITVNTLVNNSELEAVGRYLGDLYRIGVDAVIVQDLGVLRLARKLLPDLKIHASTQMTVMNSQGAALLGGLGVARVVLAREVALTDMQEIVNLSGVETEVFVHGAVCVCYSGQCLMSSLIGGRSGNRGRCAQPCRLPYKLVEKNGGDTGGGNLGQGFGPYLLSPKDLRLGTHLTELAGAGVAALKIEGRMKRPEYVATVTRVYRQVLDRVFAGGDGRLDPEEEKELWQIFNRGFTTGYFLDNQGSELMSYLRPNNRGTKLGRVLSYDPGGRITVQLDDTLRVGDGIEVWVSRGGRVGTEVHHLWHNGVEAGQAFSGETVTFDMPKPAWPGDRVFKTMDAALIEKARRSYLGPGVRKIPVHAVVKAAVGRPLTIILEDADGFKSQAETSFIAETAIKHPLGEGRLREQMERLGDTPFVLESLAVEINGEVMVPVSEINDARRRAAAELEQLRLDRYHRESRLPYQWEEDLLRIIRPRAAEQPSTTGHRGQKRAKPVLAVTVGSENCLREAVLAGADLVYFSLPGLRPTATTRCTLTEAAGFCQSRRGRVILALPRVWHEHESAGVAELVRLAVDLPADGLLAADLGGLRLALNSSLPVHTDFSIHAFNRLALGQLSDLGVTQVTVSPELTMEQLQSLGFPTDLGLEIIVHGALPMMVSEYCAIGAVAGNRKPGQACSRPCRRGSFQLVDRQGYRFPVKTDGDCRMYVLNPMTHCLIEHVPELVRVGARAWRLEARWAEPAVVREVTEAYRYELDLYWADPKGYTLVDKPEKVAGLCPGGTTKGHYFRGVE